MSLKNLLMVMLVVFICFGCQKKPETTASAINSPAPSAEETAESIKPSATYPDALFTEKEPVTTETTVPTIEPSVTTVPIKRIPLDFSFLDKINLTDNSSFHADAHKKYLDDKLDFSHYEQLSKADNNKCYLVGSEFCKLYPRDLLSFQGIDTAVLNPDFKGDGISIPIGTILKAAGEEIKCADKIDNWFDAFHFEDEYNYFYEVEYNGQTGLVFGADLGVSFESSYENDDYWYDRHSSGEDHMAYYADLYKKDGILDYFSPLDGLDSIPGTIQEYLIKNRIVLQETDPSQHLRVDDMIDRYSRFDTYLPMFITTDLASHSQHLVFDRLLQYTEETYFVPRIREICSSFITAIKEQTDVPYDIKFKALSYFQVPELILRTTPVPTYISDGWMTEKKYVAPNNVNEIIQDYPYEVKADFKQIQEASGDHSIVFGTREDFTQYKPRGHYTKNGVLESYFKASMWFGRIHFAITGEDPEALEMTPIALFIVDTVKKNPALYEKWKEVFDPITTLIGESDDLGFPDILPLWSDQNVDDFNAWAGDKANFVKFMKLCEERLKPPAISSNTVFLGIDENGPITLEKPPMGWRFLGQRYTLDADLFQQVYHPNVQNRTNVRGLDIMSMLGSTAAQSFISMQDYIEPTAGNLFAGGQTLKDAHERMKKRVNKLDTSYWTKTYYTNILATIRAQATFGQGAGFYFTECPMWNIKSLISSHATWAELKHDTILYSKQNYAEKGGGDDWAPTFRTKKLPTPKNYIEPNLSFWEMSLNSVKQLVSTYSSYNLMDEETERILGSLFNTYSRIYTICKKEVDDISISEEDNTWIRIIPDLFADYVMIHQQRGNYSQTEQKDLQMACIADVFTNSDTKECLEVGVGVPYKVFIPLNDCNGKRIAVGYIPSYYEFYQPISNRLNDDEWKASVYSSSADLHEKKPFWSNSCILPAKQF